MQGINKSVEIHECVQSKVDVGSLLGIRAFSLDKMLAEDPDFLVGKVWESVVEVLADSLLNYWTFSLGSKCGLV